MELIYGQKTVLKRHSYVHHQNETDIACLLGGVGTELSLRKEEGSDPGEDALHPVSLTECILKTRKKARGDYFRL